MQAARRWREFVRRSMEHSCTRERNSGLTDPLEFSPFKHGQRVKKSINQSQGASKTEPLDRPPGPTTWTEPPELLLAGGIGSIYRSPMDRPFWIILIQTVHLCLDQRVLPDV